MDSAGNPVRSITMPIIIRAHTTGGGRVKDFGRRLGRRFPLFLRRVNRRIAREILPQIRRDTPERSGRLRNGFRLVPTRQGLELRNTQFYARAATFPDRGRGQRTVRAIVDSATQQRLDQIVTQEYRRLLQQ